MANRPKSRKTTDPVHSGILESAAVRPSVTYIHSKGDCDYACSRSDERNREVSPTENELLDRREHVHAEGDLDLVLLEP